MGVGLTVTGLRVRCDAGTSRQDGVSGGAVPCRRIQATSGWDRRGRCGCPQAQPHIGRCRLGGPQAWRTHRSRHKRRPPAGGAVGGAVAASQVTSALEDCRHLTRRLEQELLRAGHRVVRVPTRLMATARCSGRAPGKSGPDRRAGGRPGALREPDLPAAHTCTAQPGRSSWCAAAAPTKSSASAPGCRSQRMVVPGETSSRASSSRVGRPFQSPRVATAKAAVVTARWSRSWTGTPSSTPDR